MRVKRTMRGLIVDEGRLNGLIVDERRLNGLAPLGAPPEISTAGAIGLAAVNGVAAYLLWTNGWKKLGAFLGFTAATGLIWNVSGGD